MADQSGELLREGLRRAAARPDGVPLLAGKNYPGLFPNSPSGRKTGQACMEQGWLTRLGIEKRGKTSQEICTLSELGLAYLLGQTNPREVLQALVQALDGCGQRLRDTQSGIETLKGRVEKVLQEIQAPAKPEPVRTSSNGQAGTEKILRFLERWQSAGNLEDCPLPELYRGVRGQEQPTTIGQFHDQVRGLLERGQIYLHPWTGPRHEIPEPALALMAGHDIAYYASLRP